MHQVRRIKFIWAIYALFVLFFALLFFTLSYRHNSSNSSAAPAQKTIITVAKPRNIIYEISDVDARAFLLQDKNSSDILYAKNIHEKMSPASLTKIMTAIVAIESNRLNDVVTITPEAQNVEPSILGVKSGEQYLLKDLLVAALVMSSNDATTAIAIHLASSTEAFAKLMNKKAKEIGMESTNFTNPSGFDLGDNLSTAYDLLLLTKYAIQLPYFNEIVNYRKLEIASLDGSKRFRVKTHNKLLEYYPDAIGIKTGYTQKAGPCLVARAKRGNKDALLIILHAKRGDRWSIARRYFDDFFTAK